MRTMNMSNPEKEVGSTDNAQVYERSQVLGLPENLWLGTTGQGQILAMALVNRSEHEMDVVLTLYNEDGSISTRATYTTPSYPGYHAY